jgi:TonB family protein
MRRYLSLLFAVVALAWSTAACAATCSKPEYPRSSLRENQEGISLIGFLIDTDGTVAQSVILGPSGYPLLDQVAKEALSKCVFKPATKNGATVRVWVQVQYVWSIGDHSELARAKHDAAVAASAGDRDALYRLSMLLSSLPGATDKERETAFAFLQDAADRGQAHAQFEIGRYHEQGRHGMTKDVDAAMPWYRKAAAQGDVLAIQRLEQGILP